MHGAIRPPGPICDRAIAIQRDIHVIRDSVKFAEIVDFQAIAD
jgi:hypothetical protein